MTHVFFCVSKNVSVSCAYTQGKREQFSGFNRTLDAINNVFRKFSAFHDETGRLNVDGMNIISNDGSNKLNRSRKARVSYKVQRTINASLNAATSTMLCVTIFVILVVWFLLPRVARLMIHTPTAISIFVCLSMVQLMAVFISMRCTLCGHFLQVALTLILVVGYAIAAS